VQFCVIRLGGTPCEPFLHLPLHLNRLLSKQHLEQALTSPFLNTDFSELEMV